MKIPFLQIANRLTGVSTPLFGVQWNPPTLDVDVAHHVLVFLEDRRVLYNPSELEVPEHVVSSILEIRAMLTDALAQTSRSSPLGEALSAMRAACRKFLDTIENDQGRFLVWRGSYPQWVIGIALGELRATFGVHLARISVSYGVDVEEQLQIIMPASSSDAES